MKSFAIPGLSLESFALVPGNTLVARPFSP